MNRLVSAGMVAALALAGCSDDDGAVEAPAPPPQAASAPASAPARRAPIYDEKADAKTLVADALKRARRSDRRVLIMYGGNWCGWCYRFNDLLHNDATIRPVIEQSYQLVHVEVRLNPDIGEGYGIDASKGFPYLTVLDAGGGVLANQETGVFEEGQGYRPARVLAFLEQHRTRPATAPATMPAAGAGQETAG